MSQRASATGSSRASFRASTWPRASVRLWSQRELYSWEGPSAGVDSRKLLDGFVRTEMPTAGCSRRLARQSRLRSGTLGTRRQARVPPQRSPMVWARGVGVCGALGNHGFGTASGSQGFQKRWRAVRVSAAHRA
eukprot:13753389-Alexandrium_andersonii.AAC.1